MSKPAPVDFYIEHGKELLNKGRIRKALNVFEEGAEIHGNIPKFLFWRGEALFRDKKLDKAERVLLELLRYKQKNIPALKKLSHVYLEQQRWGDALVIYNRIVEIKPQEKEWTDAQAEMCRARTGLDLSKEQYKSFIYTHIQKTGGSSMRLFLSEAAIRSGIPVEDLYIPGRNDVKAIDNLIMLHEPQLEEVRKRQPIVLGDHSHYNPVEIFKIPSLVDPFFFVMVREPIARVKSQYYFQCFANKESELYQVHLNDLNDEDLDETLKLISNYHITYMTGYEFWNRGYLADEATFEKACKNLKEKYDCFGVFEQMEHSLNILKKHAPKWLKLGEELPRRNKSVDAKYESQLSERVFKRAKELNHWDIKFYEYALRLFESRYEKNKFMQDKAAVKTMPGGRFHFNPQYKTDKFESGLMHEYINVLQGLRYQPVKLLEIGVAEGGSVNYFSDYFQHPDAEIIGMDYQKPLKNPNFRENINFLIGDQNDPVRLNEIGTKYGQFDVIIDDGAHTVKETRHTYDCLFPYVKPGGYFIIEDWAAEFIDSEKYAGMIDLMLDLYRESIGQHSMEMTLKLGYGFSYLMIRKK